MGWKEIFGKGHEAKTKSKSGKPPTRRFTFELDDTTTAYFFTIESEFAFSLSLRI
jgi:hypothetical protein